MKSLQNHPFILLVLMLLLLTSSCTSDDEPEEIKFPTVTLLNEPGFATGSIVVKPGESFKVKMKAETGTLGIGQVRLFEGEFAIPTNRLIINGAPLEKNPFWTTGEDINGFIYEIEVMTKNEVYSAIYSFHVTDEKTTGGLSVSDELTVTTELLTPTVNLLSATATNTAIELLWEVDNSANFSKYIIYRSRDEVFDYFPIDSISDASVKTYADKSVFFKEKYYYKIDLISSAGSKTTSNIVSSEFSGESFYIGKDITKMFLDKSRSTLYALDQSEAKVHLIDIRDGRLITSFNTGLQSSDFAVNLDSSRLYIANFASPHITVIDMVNLAQLDDITPQWNDPHFGNPYKIEYLHPNILVAANLDVQEGLQLFDIEKEEITSVNMQLNFNKAGLTTDASKTLLFVTNELSTLFRFEFSNGQLELKDESFSHEMSFDRDPAISGDGNFIFFSGFKHNTQDLRSAIYLCPDYFSCLGCRNYIYEASNDGEFVVCLNSIFNSKTSSKIKTVPVYSYDAVAIHENAGIVYVFDNPSQSIVLVPLQ